MHANHLEDLQRRRAMNSQTVKGQAPQGVWRYGVRVRGIKNRCRKVEWHVEGGQKGLGETASFDPDVARSLAQKWIAENMKTHDQAFATGYFWKIENGCETWEPMNDAHNMRVPLQ